MRLKEPYYKDIPQAAGVDNPMLLERLLYTLAGQFTGVLSPTAICQSFDGLTQPTFDRYLSHLVNAYLVFVLQNYSGREITRQKKGRKLYFVDGAIRNAALQRGVGPLRDMAEMGLLIENLVAGHLHALSQQSQIRLHHWRDGNNEVDIVYDHPREPLAFEIASSVNHTRRGLQRFISRYPQFNGRCFIVAPNIHTAVWPSKNDIPIGQLPVDLLLVAASAQTEKVLIDRLTPVGRSYDKDSV